MIKKKRKQKVNHGNEERRKEESEGKMKANDVCV